MEYPTALVTGNNRDTRIWSSEKNGASIHVAIIATQPHYTAKVCQDITDSVRTAGGHRQLIVVTVCPGITVSQLEAWLPKRTPIMRTMPNTPISVKQGATAIFSNQYMTSSLSAEVQLIFKSISPEVALLPEEDLMDIAASVSGSAPAYLYHLVRSLVAAGTARGLPADMTTRLVVQACLGAAKLAQASQDTPMEQLLSDVCVPGGSTEKAVQALDRHGASKAVDAAVETSWHANRAMSGDVGPPAHCESDIGTVKDIVVK
uniref:WGS project CBMG000000000 data, contig CS5907-c000348 n=1 Tax=Fusarium acuminatum CS5907 TaxID=1318461 RepID=A0A096PE23_9HYPO|nr:unnamed protein product [Fusarium acuminatum CS5907]